MACKIWDTSAGKYLKDSKLNIPEGFFDSKGFISSFGDWINNEVSPIVDDNGNLTRESRVLLDGSPRIHYNGRKTRAFYYNKQGRRIPINEVEFSSIPAEDRAEISYGVNDALLYEIYLSLGLDGGLDAFLGSDATLESLYDEIVEEFIEDNDLSPMVQDTLLLDKKDHLRLIKNRLRALGIQYRLVEEETEEIREDGSFAVVQKPSYERRPTEGVSAEIKRMLEYIQVVTYDKNGRKISKNSPYVPSTPEFMNPTQAYTILLDNIANSAATLKDNAYYNDVSLGIADAKNSFKIIKEGLNKLSVEYPWVKDILVQVENSSEEFKMQFVQAFSLSKNNIVTTEVNKGKYTMKDTSNSGKEMFGVMTDWVTSIKHSLYSGMDKNASKDYKEMTSSTRKELRGMDKALWEKDNDQIVLETWELLQPIVSKLDMNVDYDVYSKYIDLATATTTVKSDADIKRGIIKAAEQLIGKFDNIANQQNIEQAKSFARANLKELATAYVQTYSAVSDHMATVGSKRLYLYSAPTVLQRQIEEWKEDPSIVKDIVENVRSLKNSVWLNAFVNTPSKLDKFKVSLRGQLQNQGRSRTGRDAKSIQKADYVKNDLFGVLRKNGKNYDPIVPTQVPADKNREYMLNPGVFIETDSTKDAYDKVFKGYIEDELNKMYEAHEQIRDALKQTKGDVEQAAYLLTPGYHTDALGNIYDENGLYAGEAFKIGIFEGLNNVPEVQSVLNNIRKGVFNWDLSNGRLNAALESHIVTQLDRVIDENIDYLNELNIYYTDNKKLLGYNSISSDIKNDYKDKGKTEEAINREIVKDYVINSVISKIEYAKLFTGNLQYYGSKERGRNAKYIKRVPATYIDGKVLAVGVTEGDINFDVMTFATEYIVDSDLLNKDSGLTEHVKDYYREVDRTDGQGWITPERWEFILRRSGKLNKDNVEILKKLKRQWASIDKGGSVAPADMLTKEEVKLISAQPIKGVYFKNDLKKGPVYLKYSQAVLIPSVAANQPKMKKLLKYMRDNNISEAIADSGIKVGMLKPQPLFDAEGNFLPKKGAPVLTLDNRNYRLQQDLPTKTIRDNKIGTQIQKIIVSELRIMGNVKVHPNFTANQLADSIDKALSNLSDFNVEKFLKSFNIDKEGKINSLSEFYAPILEDMKKDGIPVDNIKKGIEAELPLSAMPHIKDTVIATFMSKLKKAATNLLTSGGGFIQISDHLIGLNEIKQTSGIKMLVEDFDRLQPPRLEGKTVIPGQVFIPHSIVAKLIPNYTELSTEELRKRLSPKVMRMIGYRIPTQSRASTDLFDVVGILPPEYGDSVIAYGEITAKTGSDFDIDKLYFMLPELVKGTKVTPAVTKTKEVKTIEEYTEEAEGIEGIAKPIVNEVEILSAEELVARGAKYANEQDRLLKEQEDLEKLIDCLWK